jgi:hypothetical protein
MRFENDSMVLWYATPDAPAPSGDVPVAPGSQQALVTINAKVQPPSASNTVQVIYRINEGPFATAIAALQDHDLLQKAQSFSVRLPALHLGDRVDYYIVARCPGRQVPAVPQAGQQLESFQVVLPVAAAGAACTAPANRTAMLKGNSPGTGYPGPAKMPLGAARNPAAGSFPARVSPPQKVKDDQRQQTGAVRLRKILPLPPAAKSESTRFMRSWPQRKRSKR